MRVGPRWYASQVCRPVCCSVEMSGFKFNEVNGLKEYKANQSMIGTGFAIQSAAMCSRGWRWIVANQEDRPGGSREHMFHDRYPKDGCWH